MKLLRTDVMIFIFIFIITIIFISFLTIIKPNTTPLTINKSPLPQVNPGYVKNSNPQVLSSCKTLLSCDPDQPQDFCNKQCQNENDQINYECKRISTDPNDINYLNIYYNGTKVPTGNWCLPKFQDNIVCNSYTDSFIWADYAGMQEWACKQSYPQFFYNEVYLGCKDFSEPGKNDTVSTIVSKQQNNKLVSVTDKKVFDPINDPNFGIEWGNSGPFDKDDKGNNLFECGCERVDTFDEAGNSAEGITFKLPGDPYNCHLNPCMAGGIFLKNKNNEIETGLEFSGKNGEPVCNCDNLTNFALKGDSTDSTLNNISSGVGGHVFAKSKYDNKCKDATVTCSNGFDIKSLDSKVWDKDNNICMCNQKDGYFAVHCRSKLVDNYIEDPANKNDPNLENMKKWVKCNDYNYNMLGSECRYGCDDANNPCAKKEQCHIRDNKVYCDCPRPDIFDTDQEKYCPNKINGYTQFGQGSISAVDLPYQDETGVIDYTNKYVKIDTDKVQTLNADCKIDCIPSGQICGTTYSLLNAQFDRLLSEDFKSCTLEGGCTRNGVFGGSCCSGKVKQEKGKPDYKYGVTDIDFPSLKDNGLYYYTCE